MRQSILNFFQLADIDSIRIIDAGSHIDDATGYAWLSGLTNRSTYRNNPIRSIRSLISWEDISFSNLAAIANSRGLVHTTLNACIITKSHVITGNGRSIGTYCNALITGFCFFAYSNSLSPRRSACADSY